MPTLRDVGRTDNWWYSKVAPALAVSWCAALLFGVPAWPAARTLLLIAFIGLCAGSYGHMINDAFDIEVDRRAGKSNHMAAFTLTQRWAFCLLAVALGFAPALFLHFSRISLALLAAEYLVPTIYSVPPLRFKERGFTGLLCDSLGAHLLPCLFCISLMATQSPVLAFNRVHLLFIGITAVWAFSLGLIGILIHEFEDRANDLASGIRTFATTSSFAAVRFPLTALYIIELIAFAAFVTLLFPVAPVLAIAAAVYFVVIAIKMSRDWTHYRRYEDEAVAIQWWQFSHPFYENYFPLVVAIQFAWLHPWMSLFPALLLAVFAHTFSERLAELRSLPQAATELFLWRGRIDHDASAIARIRARLSALPGARLHITAPGPDPWSIRLIRPGLSLREGRLYRVHCTARADAPRSVCLGVWQDHEPWSGLGFYEELPLTTQWTALTRDFIANTTDPRAYVGLWLGANATSVDVRRCTVYPVGFLRRLAWSLGWRR